MFVQGGVTQAGKKVATADFVRFLAQRVPAGAFFVVDPPPGISMASAIDWRIVLDRASAMAEVGAALWSGYETFVRGGAGTAAEMLVQVKNCRKEFDQFVIGREIADEKALLHRLKESARLLTPKGEDAFAKEVAETEASGYWVRIS